MPFMSPPRRLPGTINSAPYGARRRQNANRSWVSVAPNSLDIALGWEMSFIEYKRTISAGDYVVGYKVSGVQRKG